MQDGQSRNSEDRSMGAWDPIELRTEDCRRWRLGPARVCVRRTDAEWHVAVVYEAESADEDVTGGDRVVVEACEPPPEGLEWRRWVAAEDGGVVQVTPMMPDRAVVVRPEQPISIPSGAKAQFFVSIPVWLRISAGPGKATTLSDLPTAILSNIWFGDPMSGELCYSLKTRARRTFDAADTRANCALSPLLIENAASEQLPFERLCIRAEHLAVYPGESQLWTNAVTVKSRGADETGQLDYGQSPPRWEPVGKPLCDPREPFNRGMLKRTFSNIKVFSGV